MPVSVKNKSSITNLVLVKDVPYHWGQ